MLFLVFHAGWSTQSKSWLFSFIAHSSKILVVSGINTGIKIGCFYALLSDQSTDSSISGNRTIPSICLVSDRRVAGPLEIGGG